MYPLKYCLSLLVNVCLAQQPTSSDDDFFDPQVDPIASTIEGRLRLAVSEDVLVRSVVVKFPKVGAVEKVDRQKIEGYWWLTLESRHSDDIEQSVFLAVRLKPDDNGNYFEDSFWTACIGEGCGGCDFKYQLDGCFCRFDRPGEPGTPGACYQATSDERLMTKVSIKR
ncbi:MAG: hypothetical protein KF734_21400 [Saprospiraceae bacterium]|nr:hypothetical protein [Saprospiraceae bacterium]